MIRKAAASLLLLLALGARGQDIGFVEKFSLAADRAVPLKELIPGTEEYYYYNCLHLQNSGDFKGLHELLDQWVKRSGHTQGAVEIENRQALLEYKTDAKKSLDFIVWRLGVQFNHQKQQLNPKTDLPTQIDPNLLSRDRLLQWGLSEQRHVERFEDTALDFLMQATLTPDQRRNLLSRLQRPDYPGLPAMVVEDLKYPRSGGFGSLAIHRQLLVDQLEECLKLLPDLIRDTNFINAYLIKLRPSEDVEWEHDPVAKDAYLARLETFINRLPPAQNSLKAHVLYQRLLLEQSRGVYDAKRFMEYLKLPRQVFYINPDYLRRAEFNNAYAILGMDFQAVTALPPIGGDEPLARDFLQHLLLDAADYNAYAEYIESNYLKALFAETKIVNGIGDMEQWYSLLRPEQARAIKERVDIELLPTNPEIVGAETPVTLDVAVKNVAKLLVKTYEINTLNFYRENNAEITTAIDLDGLVANQEQSVEYAQPPLRRHVEHFALPNITRPGVYVVEFIGNGISSRALIRKGRLTFTERLGAAGHVFTVLDEKSAVVRDASLWMAGQLYRADEQGEIAVPFSTAPGRQSVVLLRGDFAALGAFEHRGENYAFDAGFYVDRETLLPGKNTRVLIRPSLSANGIPLDIGLVEEVTLTIRTADRDGIAVDKLVKDIKLANDRETECEFKTPDRLAQLTFILRGKVKNLSQGNKTDVAASFALALNGIAATEKTEDLHLRHFAGQYVLQLLGRSGEARPDRAVNFNFKHRDFREMQHATLKTDAAGTIRLGPLTDVVSVTACGPQGDPRTWLLRSDRCSPREVVHALAGERVTLAYMGPPVKTTADAVSLLETRDGVYVRDCRDSVRVENGFVVIDDLAAGDYSLWIKPENRVVTLRLTQGVRQGVHLIARDRILEHGSSTPLQIVAMEADAQNVRVRLANATPATRVHVVATRFDTGQTGFDALGAPLAPPAAESRLQRPLSRYLSGRNIGDEYRYIMERKLAPAAPGNMLRRPSLLLNPWSLRKTDTGQEFAAAGEAYGRVAESEVHAKLITMEPGGGGGRASVGAEGYASYDFLAAPSAVLANLKPDAAGVVTIPRKDLGAGQQVRVLALNPDSAVTRELALEPKVEEYKDLRLTRFLDPASHYTEQKKVSLAPKAKPFVIADITTADFDVYDSLPRAYGLFATLSGDPTLAEFNFILTWPDLTDARKRELYSKYACHELNFFLFKKDPAFFKTVIRPYLANKKDRTFMDDWLLEGDLAGYLEPWRHARLNVVERILLAQRLPAETAAAARHVGDLYDLIAPDIERFNRLFDTAIKSLALESAGDVFGADGAREQLLSEVNGDSDGLDDSKVRADGPPSKRPNTSRLRALAKNGKELKAPDLPAEMPAEAAAAPSTSAPPPAPALMRKADELGDKVGQDKKQKGEKDETDRNARMDRDARRRNEARQLYRKLDTTEEWVENNYYHLPLESQLAALVTVNGFWKDYAAHKGDGPFLSASLAEASHSFTEMMLALAVLDLPFKAGVHKSDFDGAQMSLTPADPVVVFHKEIKDAKPEQAAQVVLVSQNFFAQDDRYRFENNERFDKFITAEFVVARVYGSQVVLTNPTSTRRKVDTLLQIPAGAVPVLGGFYTRSIHMQLEPYSTQTFEYYFYFPKAGQYGQFPAHVAQNETVIAFARPFSFNVVDVLTQYDKEAWSYISQYATDDELIRYLETHNIDRLDLNLIAFRMRDKAMFQRVLPLLAARHVYQDVLWSYGLLHNDVPAIRQYLRYSAFARQCGLVIDSPLLTLDPVERYDYQHREYWPLVNARVYQLGKVRKILNRQFHDQYELFMRCLQYKAALNDDDKMTVVTYLLLQDRVAEAATWFARINAKAIHAAIQYDYLKAYMAFSSASPAEARKLATPYRDHPVERWRNLFADVLAQVDEIEGKGAAVVDKEDRTQKQTALADTAPSFEFDVENRAVTIRYQNLETCTINYYPMDIELLFSRNPFVQEVSGQFGIIRPNETAVVPLGKGRGEKVVKLPAAYHNRNVMLEILGEGVRHTKAYTPHSLNIQMMEGYGQLRVTQQDGGKPLARVYVKVYAKFKDGSVRFYKDGYTDLRGRFDYTSLSTNELEQVDKFSILLMSDENGAVVREAAPPKM